MIVCALPILIAGRVVAQEPVITVDTQVTPQLLHQWLHSDDPRLVTWAADFAQRRHDQELLNEMPEMLDHWISNRRFEDNDRVNRLAVMGMLDALIQENIHTSVSTIAKVAGIFPAQAAILISRLPRSE